MSPLHYFLLIFFGIDCFHSRKNEFRPKHLFLFVLPIVMTCYYNTFLSKAQGLRFIGNSVVGSLLSKYQNLVQTFQNIHSFRIIFSYWLTKTECTTHLWTWSHSRQKNAKNVTDLCIITNNYVGEEKLLINSKRSYFYANAVKRIHGNRLFSTF